MTYDLFVQSYIQRTEARDLRTDILTFDSFDAAEDAYRRIVDSNTGTHGQVVYTRVIRLYGDFGGGK